MIVLMARNGVSGYVLARMVLNILIDTIIGSIPLIGDLFDVAFKANLKNMRLLKEHYVEGRHQGSALKVIIPILAIVLILIIALTYLCYKLIAALAHNRQPSSGRCGPLPDLWEADRDPQAWAGPRLSWPQRCAGSATPFGYA